MHREKRNLLASYAITCVFILFYGLHLMGTNPLDGSATINIITADAKENYQKVEECSCSRSFMYPPLYKTSDPSQIFPRLNSSCSDEGTWSQADQKVITFSLFVNEHHSGKLERFYREGLVQNLKMMRKFYPGFSLRLYTNFTLIPENPYCKILCSNSDLFWCNVKVTPSHGDLSEMVFRTWRFLVLGDPTVDVFLSRDLDSLLSGRETAVVKDWLSKDDKAISLMRDRKGGHDEPILAGMWQASNKLLGHDNASSLREEIINLSKMKKQHKFKSSDQKILNKVVFYPQAKNIVAYDSYNCVKWGKFTEVRPFPTPRGDPRRDFVGNKVDFLGGRGRLNYSGITCPVDCRPEHGKEWVYC